MHEGTGTGKDVTILVDPLPCYNQLCRTIMAPSTTLTIMVDGKAMGCWLQLRLVTLDLTCPFNEGGTGII
ncbi:hypothetical protein GDO81_020525 [Engystomops pustulosus]|uniref:Uncharacterized protein n=1 Tax=Engystomops pustulosus TaxID=76066 RepID=A0AAV6YV56_ENGPU|nr:hypothetical protein GDO81_020525 [Engystomops pustulosus]